MIEIINEIDTDLFLFLNSFHSSVFDRIMNIITHRSTWIPMYLLLIYFLVTKKRMGWQLVLVLLIAVSFSDFITSHLLKPFIGRLRPCHLEAIQNKVHVVEKCGGMYGMPSSHAANSFTLAFLMNFFFKNRNVKLFYLWAAVVSYSRIYVGVHYPFDILLGICCAFIISKLIFNVYIYQLKTKNSIL